MLLALSIIVVFMHRLPGSFDCCFSGRNGIWLVHIAMATIVHFHAHEKLFQFSRHTEVNICQSVIVLLSVLTVTVVFNVNVFIKL